jgi:hypothetical protein
LVAIVAVGLVLVRVGGQTLAAAWYLYRSHWRVFAALGVVLIPVGLAANAVQSVFVDHPPGKQILDALDRGPGAQFATVLTIGGLQQALNLLLIGPAVIVAVGEIRAGRVPSFGSSYRVVFRRFKPVVLAVAGSLLIVFALALSVVGIPWAISRAIRWLFVSQAVLLDNAGPRAALTLSSRAVAGRWWRTAATSLLLSFVEGAAAPLLGILFLVVVTPAIRSVNWLSSFLYAVLVPLSVIGLTLLYLDLRGDPIPVSRQPAAGPRDQPALAPVAPPA